MKMNEQVKAIKLNEAGPNYLMRDIYVSWTLNSLTKVRSNRAKKILVSGNAGDEKNLHPGCRKFIFLIDFPEIFSFLF